jgi:hypothetical protein
MIRGTPRANGIVVSSFSVDWATNPITVNVKAAYVNADNGVTYSWIDTRKVKLSKETLTAIEEAHKLIEQDVAKNHLVEGGDGATSGARGMKMRDVSIGLGEQYPDDTPG